MKKILSSLTFAFLSLVFSSTVSAATEQELAKIPSDLLELEWAMQIVIVALAGGILYSIFRAIQVYGGLIGNSLKLIGVGIFFLALETLNRVLERFLIDYVEEAFGPSGQEVFFAALKAIGFLLLAIGFQRLTSVFQGPPKDKK